MAEVTGRIGENDVELDNAATEATLKAILLSMAGSTKNMNRLLKLAEKAGMDPRAIKDAEEAMRRLAENSKQASLGSALLSKSLGALGKTATILGGIVGDLAAGAFQTVGNLTSLAGTLVDGQGAVSDVVGAFRDLPLGIGLVAGAFQKLMQMQEAELDTYRQLTKTGVNFGGALTDIRNTALGLGLTLEQFSTVIATNSQALASMGAGTNEGAKNFVRLAKDLRNSNIGAELRALGLTAEETANGLANYIKMTGGRTADEMRNTKGLSEAAGQYIKQLDMLATITGKSREEQEKALLEAQQNAAFEAYMQTLDEDGRKKAMAGLAQALAVGGKGAVQSLQAKLMGLPDITEASQTFRGTMQNASKGVDQIAAAITNSGSSIDDVNKAGAAAMTGSFKDLKTFGTTLVGAMSMMGGPQAEAIMTAQGNYNRALKQGATTQAEYEALMKKVQDEQKRRESQAAKAAEAEKALRDLTQQVFSALLPLIKTLTEYVTALLPQFAAFVEKSMPAVREGAERLAEWLKLSFTEEGRKQMLADIKHWLVELFKEVADIIKGAVVGPKVTEQNQAAWEKQNEINKSVMTFGERTSTFMAEFLEGFAGLFNEDFAKRIAADRIRSDTEEGIKSGRLQGNPGNVGSVVPRVSRASGTLGSTGKLFENFGSGTPAELHGTESVVTPSQMSELLTSAMKTGQDNNLVDELKMLNKQTAEMLAYIRDSADSGRRSVDALRGLSGNLFPV